MADINSNLNNLFKNYQQQQKYKKKAFDVNGDGKINSKDKNELSKTEKNLLKKKTLFDFNNDGKFDQLDIDLFTKGDFDGDGKITKEEMNFISKYKTEMKKDFISEKADFMLDGKMYVAGKLALGVFDGKYYRYGVLVNGIVNGKRYVKGELANGLLNNSLYKDGKLFTGINSEGKHYKNGKLLNGTVKEGKATCLYKKGVLQYSVVDNTKGGLPNASGGTIKFSGKVKVQLDVGDKAVINKDGTVEVTSKDGSVIKKYDKKGKLVSEMFRKVLAPGEKYLIDNVLVNNTGNKEEVLTFNHRENMATGEQYVVLKANNMEIKSADENLALDKVFIEGDNNNVLGSKNNDNVIVKGKDNNIDVGDGNDKIVVIDTGGETDVNIGKGNDNVIFASKGLINFYGGDGYKEIVEDTTLSKGFYILDSKGNKSYINPDDYFVINKPDGTSIILDIN